MVHLLTSFLPIFIEFPFSVVVRVRPSSPMPINIDDSALDNPNLGPFLLKLARDSIAGGDGPNKALDYAIRASKSFERCNVDGEPSLNLDMSLHVVGAIYCSLGRFEDAVPVLERAVKPLALHHVCPPARSESARITTGKIYQQVIEKERTGDYLGKTVQIIPHVTNAIQEWIERVAKIPVDGKDGPPDICVIELGGTIGEIESRMYIEALSQLSCSVGTGNFCLVHFSLVPVINVVGGSDRGKAQGSVLPRFF